MKKSFDLILGLKGMGNILSQHLQLKSGMLKQWVIELKNTVLHSVLCVR